MRHIVVNTLGLLVNANAYVAMLQHRDGGPTLLNDTRQLFAFLTMALRTHTGLEHLGQLPKLLLPGKSGAGSLG